MTSPSGHPRRRKALFAAILLCLGLLLGLVGVELVLRAFDPYEFGERIEHDRFIAGIHGETPPGRRPLESFYLRPNAHVEFLGASFDINADGYRTPPVPREKPDDVYRIVVVGDSVPFGWGVPAEATFPRRLETLLNEREQPFGRSRVEVVNLSGPGRGLGDYYIVLQDDGLRYEPDLVLIPFIFNDVPLQAVDPKQDAAPLPIQLPSWGRSSYAMRWMFRTLNELRGVHYHDDYWIELRSSPEAAQLCCMGFRLLDELAGDVPLVIFDTVGEEPGQPLPQVVTCTREMGIPRIECFLRKDEWNERWAIDWPVHKHPNVAAHEVYAQTILTWLDQHGWLK